MSWAPAGPERYGLFAGAPQSPAVAGSALNSLATPSEGAASAGKAFHPDNPLVLWGIAAGLTFGLMAFSTSGSVRVGKTKLSAGLGIGNAS